MYSEIYLNDKRSYICYTALKERGLCMKRFLLAAALISVVFCTSGCIKTSYNIEIDKKNNITVSETDAYNQELFQALAKDSKSAKDLADIDNSIESDKESLKAEGYDVTDYEENGFKGLVIKKTYPKNSLKDTDLPIGFTSAKTNPLVVEKGFLKTYYHLNMVYDVNEAAQNNKNMASLSVLSNNVGNQTSSEDDNNENTYTDESNDSESASSSTDTSSNASVFNNIIKALTDTVPELTPSMDLTIKIPYKATQTNATKVLSDTDYFWQLDPKEKNRIYINYERYNYGNIIMVIFVLIASILFGIYYKKFLNTSNW